MTIANVQLSTGPASVSYRTEGSGPDVVLLHGAGASTDTNWNDLFPALSATHRVTGIDLIGSGATTDSGGDISQADLRAAVIAALDDANVDTCTMIGYSLGAHVAISIAGHEPQRVDRLVAIAPWLAADTFLGFEFDLWQRLFDLGPEIWARFATFSAFSHQFFDNVDLATAHSTAETFAQIAAPGTGRQARYIASSDITSIASSVRAPTTIIGLNFDQQVPLRYAHAAHEAIEGSQIIDFDHGHGFPWENTPLLVKTIGELVLL